MSLLSIRSSRVIHVVACAWIFFILKAVNDSIIYATFSSNTPLLLNVWIVPTAWLLWTWVYKYLFEILSHSFGYILCSGLVGSCSNSIFNVLNSCHLLQHLLFSSFFFFFLSLSFFYGHSNGYQMIFTVVLISIL